MDPNDPAAVEFLAQAGPRTTIEGLVDRLARYRWVGRQGPEPYRQVLETGEGNCLALSGLLCSALLRARIRPSYVMVAGGGLLGRALVAVDDARGILTAHSWTVIARPDGPPLVVDPVFRRLEVIDDSEALEARLRLAAPVDAVWSFVFDKDQCHFFANPRACFDFLTTPTIAV